MCQWPMLYFASSGLMTSIKPTANLYFLYIQMGTQEKTSRTGKSRSISHNIAITTGTTDIIARMNININESIRLMRRAAL